MIACASWNEVRVFAFYMRGLIAQIYVRLQTRVQVLGAWR
jgi:hypothetical protein